MNSRQSGKIKILIDHSKQCDLSNMGEYRTFYRRLQSLYKVEIDKESELNSDRLQDISLIILSAANKEFDSHEIRSLCNYVENGGNLLIFGTEGTEKDNNELKQKYLNNLINKFGIHLNYDSLIRMIYSESYFHPKEAKIENCIINGTMNDFVNNSNYQNTIKLKGKKRGKSRECDILDDDKPNSSIIYPYGCTLGITSEHIIPLISSQEFCFPKQQTLCCLYEKYKKNNRGPSQMHPHSPSGSGSVIVYGAVKSFNDFYIEKEDNLYILLSMIEYLTSSLQNKSINSWLLNERNRGKMSKLKQNDNFFNSDNDDYKFMNDDDENDMNLSNIDIRNNPSNLNKQIYNDKHIELPNIAAIADTVQSCLEQPAELKDFDQLFNFDQFEFSNHLYKDVISDLYKKLNVEISANDENQNHLTLIKPQFEVPLPPLQPAVFLPTFLEPMPPNLELFDIDDELQSTQTRLVTFYNKINKSLNDDEEYDSDDREKDLEIYVQGCGEILGIIDQVNEENDDSGNTDNDNNELTQTQKCMKILNIVANEIIKAKAM